MSTRLADLSQRLAASPSLDVGRFPTLLEPLQNLGADLGISLFAKRDDSTGIDFGGNKVRQLKYYLGAALVQEADTILITGAVQSNFARTAAALAGRLGLACHIQLEERVEGLGNLYRENGNVLLDRLLGATLHSYPEGEDEAGADAAMAALAEELKQAGKRPYIISLGADHPPLGALGYVEAAIELAGQLDRIEGLDQIFVASGSANTHCGLLFGLRALGIETPVRGICVRRAAALQAPRVAKRLADLAALLDMPSPIRDGDVQVYDGALAPGYGQVNPAAQNAIERTARKEGFFLDPVYTGKVMAGLIQLAKAGELKGQRVLFWHTGGQAALFAYGDRLT